MFAAKDRKQQPDKLAAASKSRSKTPSDLQKQPLDSLQLLQRSLGNNYLQALSQTAGQPDGLFVQQKDDRRMLQPKLVVGAANDIYEQEADRVAGQVMRMPEPKIQRLCPECEDELQRQPMEEEEKKKEEEETLQTKPLAESITPLIQRQTEPTEEEEKKKEDEETLQTKPLAESIAPLVQRQTEPTEEEEKKKEEEEILQTKTASGEPPTVSSSWENQITALQGGGQPLPQSERNFFEPRFGTDFSRVRLHTDRTADSLNRSLNARAFTTGQDVFFRQGEYDAQSARGKELLAHELTHVVQQRKNHEYIQRGVRKVELTPQEEFDWDIGILKSEIARIKNLRLSLEQKISRVKFIQEMYSKVSSSPYFIDFDPKIKEEITTEIKLQNNAIAVQQYIEKFLSKVEWWTDVPKGSAFERESREIISCLMSEGIHLEECTPDDTIKVCLQKVLKRIPWVKCFKEFAKRHCPDVENLTEEKKQQYFKTDINRTIAIILYEFATGTGPADRTFKESTAITQVYKRGRAVEQALDDFYEKNIGKGVNELTTICYKYEFSPTFEPPFFNLSKSIKEHEEAIKEVTEKGTWSSFFIGGVDLRVIPQPGNMLRVIIENITGKESLMLHIVPDIERDPERLTELGTTKQSFEFEIPLEPERLKTITQKIEGGVEDIVNSVKKGIDILVNPSQAPEEMLQRQPLKREKEEEKQTDLRPPAKDSRPTPDRIFALRRWLTAHIAGYALADKTYTFYEIVDQYLGPWGEGGYPIAYGKHYNVLFTTNKSLIANPVTQDWVWRTTVLLQKALLDFIVTRYSNGTLSSLTEAELRQAAFNSHPMAYTEAGLAKVVAVDPDLIPVIASIPAVEFSPTSENFAASIKQVTETAVMVIPQTLGLLLASVMPAHSGMLRTASEIDRRNFMAEIRLNEFLGQLLKDIESGRITSIVLLEQITQKLYEQEFLNQDFAKFARQVINAANQRKKELARQYADRIKKNPKLKPLYDTAQPGWEKWLQ